MPLAMQNAFFQKRCPSVAKVKLQEKYHICMMLKSASKRVSLKRTHHSILYLKNNVCTHAPIYLFIHLFIKSPTEKGKTVTNVDLFYLLLVTKQFRKRLT